jgi:hypothetical protein
MTNPLLQEIEAFLEREDVRITETAFGIAALNDGKFVSELRGGRRVWPDTAERVRAFITAELEKLGAGSQHRDAAA